MKVSCISIDHLPVQIERQRDPALVEQPLIVGGRPWDDGAVLDCCPAAAEARVSPGMRLAQAEVLCPLARFVPSNEAAYRAAHDAMIAAIARLTPTVETAGLGLAYAEVSGLERTWGADPQLARRLSRAVEHATGLAVETGLATNKFVARQAAATAQPRQVRLVPAGQEHSFLAPLPLEALVSDPETARRLHMLGITTLGGVAALPRRAMIRQFGAQMGPLHDLASGIDPRPVQPTAPPLAIERNRIFNEPLEGRTPLLAHLEKLAAALGSELTCRGYQAEGLRLSLFTEADQGAAGASVKPPSADGAKLTRLAGRLLEQAHPGKPIIALTLTIYPLRPAHWGVAQLSLLEQVQQGKVSKLRETLRGLRGRFGEPAVMVAALASPPPPCQIQVTTGPDGVPRALFWQRQIHPVTAVYESWKEQRRWWSRPVERDYYRLEIAASIPPHPQDRQMRVIFQDRSTEQWLLERRHL